MVIYTTAPKSFDKATTIELDDCVARPDLLHGWAKQRRFRKVLIPDDEWRDQDRLYAGGAHVAYRQDFFDACVLKGTILLLERKDGNGE